MAQRFFNKGSRVKYVKPYVNKRIAYLDKKENDNIKEEVVPEKEKADKAKNASQQANKKNKQAKKESSDMIDIDRLNDIISGEVTVEELPKTVKIEKSKGLIEREKSSKVILTEDNKMLLVD